MRLHSRRVELLKARSRPRLLVSVRSVAEASAAIAGGCDILDVKEPSRGSLGMADVETIGAIAALPEMGRRELPPSVSLPTPPAGAYQPADSFLPLSAALGETADWLAARQFPRLPANVDYAKLGTAGLGRDRRWVSRWTDVRRRFDEAGGRSQETGVRSQGSGDRSQGPDSQLSALNSQLSTHSPLTNWIAVAYADWQACEAPCPESIVEAAIEAACTGVLFDTFYKKGRTLFDELTAGRLAVLIARIHDAGLIAALAGGITLALLPVAVGLGADVLAVRSSACFGGDRGGVVSEEAVRRLKAAIAAGARSLSGSIRGTVVAS